MPVLKISIFSMIDEHPSRKVQLSVTDAVIEVHVCIVLSIYWGGWQFMYFIGEASKIFLRRRSTDVEP